MAKRSKLKVRGDRQRKGWATPTITVLDANVLRDRDVVVGAAKDAYELRGAVLVPIIVFAELVKNEDRWAETVCGSLSELAPISEVLICGAELSHVMQKERLLSSPIIEYGDEVYTKVLTHVAKLAVEGVQPVRDFLLQHDGVQRIREDSSFLQEHEENKWSLGRDVKAFRDCLEEDDLKA